jgi:hypothetical protein
VKIEFVEKLIRIMQSMGDYKFDEITRLVDAEVERRLAARIDAVAAGLRDKREAEPVPEPKYHVGDQVARPPYKVLEPILQVIWWGECWGYRLSGPCDVGASGPWWMERDLTTTTKPPPPPKFKPGDRVTLSSEPVLRATVTNVRRAESDYGHTYLLEWDRMEPTQRWHDSALQAVKGYD